MTTIAKTDPRIMRHNTPLAEKLADQGARYSIENKLGSFKDSDGSYVPYPNGYITGPTKRNHGKINEMFYISVQTSKGWMQRTTINHTLQEIITWALTESKKHVEPA
jgi:hypothetical protein